MENCAVCFGDGDCWSLAGARLGYDLADGHAGARMGAEWGRCGGSDAAVLHNHPGREMMSGALQVYLVIGAAGALFGAWLLLKAYRAGRASEKVEQKERENEAEERVEKAAEDAPHSRDELLDRLRNGSGRL